MKSPRLVLALAVPLTVLALGTSGCAAFSDEAATSNEVAAAFYPLQYVAERVVDDKVDVEPLSQPGQEPHDLELTVAETATLSEAGLVLYEKGFQPDVDASVAENATGRTLDAGEVVGLETSEEHHAGHDHAEGHEGHDHEEGHEGHDHGDGHDHEALGDLDPHFWLDPLKMADLGDAVADEMAEVDPANAEAYRANAASLRTELEQLDAAYEDGLADCERDTVVVSHDAFGYLGRYGLEFAPINGISPDAEPTPADLADLQQLIRDEKVTTVFFERLATPKLAETLAADLGIRTDVLDPLEGLTDETADEDYLSLMEQNLDALQTANGCR